MLEISVRFLGGEYVAQTPDARSEWPPHPARLLYALVAAWYDGGCRRTERDALRWLESQAPPGIVATSDAPEEVYEAWLPMNSVPTWDRKSGKRPTLPKTRQVRASRHAGDVPVSFVWEVDLPIHYEDALRDLCRRCTRLGSAESLAAVTMGRRADLHGPAWRPSRSGTMIRIAVPGIVDTSVPFLPGRVLPCDWRAYRWSDSRRPGRMITVGLSRGNCPVELAPALAERLRQSLIEEAGSGRIPLLPILHGRNDDGSPLKQAHLHVCPLPHAGLPHATGAVLGVAFILPPDTGHAGRAYVERVIATWFARGAELIMAGGRSLVFGPADSRHTLADGRWCRAADVWQTVIPMELPRHVTRHREWNRDDWLRVRAEMERACAQAGLPEPIEIEASNTPFVVGSPHARRVRGPHRRPVAHARMRFANAVEGPVVVGAGRHLGYGLMAPARTRQ